MQKVHAEIAWSLAWARDLAHQGKSTLLVSLAPELISIVVLSNNYTPWAAVPCAVKLV